MLASTRAGGRLKSSLLGQRLEQLVGIAGVHAVRLEVAGDVRAGKSQIAGRGGQIGGAARSFQVQPERGVLGSRRTAVVGGELEGQLTGGEDLQDLGQCEPSSC